MSTNPVFIIGLHRTGSTLLKEVINQNPSIAMATDEIHLKTPWYKDFFNYAEKYGNLKNNQIINDFVDFLLDGNLQGSFWKELKNTNIDENRVRQRILNSNRSYKSLVTIIMEEYAFSEGKVRYGSKYPVHFSKVQLLEDWYPDCKIIHITRDPRAICASKVNDRATNNRKKSSPFFSPLIHYGTILFFVFEYYWSSKIHSSWSSNPNYMKIRYEDLVVNPKKTIESICDFTEIDFSMTMLNASGKSSSHKKKEKSGFDITRVYKWKKILTIFEKSLITSLTINSMKRLGYGNIEKEYKVWLTKS